MEHTGFLTRIAQLFASAFRKEVKTPLSLFFRIVGAIAFLAAIALFMFDRSAQGDASRLQLCYVVLIALGAMFLVVCIFAWFKPKNLVYGESGHRAELKMQFGTERVLVSREELELTPGILNLPAAAADEGDTSQ